MTKKQMQELVDETGLTFDGGDDDNRLFDETIFADTLSLSKEEYNAMEKELNSFKVKGKNFRVSAWNDSSGYDYWTKNQQEDNYIQITVYVDGVADSEEIKKTVQKVRNKYSKYAKFY